ncbi:MAG: DUF7674 family protein [Burkholderiales bacterium]
MFGIFPDFQPYWEDEDNPHIEEDGKFAFHAVMLEIRDYFGQQFKTFSEKQILAFSSFLNDAVLQDDKLENAVSTCFLESSGKGKRNKLWPYLNATAKRRC